MDEWDKSWMDDFRLMTLPHADEYVERVQIQKRVDQANLKLNKFYSKQKLNALL